MSKINVTLTATLDNGKETLQPGDSVSLEEKEARRLASLGMVRLPKAATKAARGKSGKKTAPPPPPPGDSDESDDTGEADQDNNADEQE